MATDLSHLTRGLLGESSMSAGNTISPSPAFTGPGTPSASGVDPRIDELDAVHDPADVPLSDHRPDQG